MGRYKISRERMVREQVTSKGITDQNVIKAMLSVPRHLFVAEALQAQSYDNNALPIGYGQTISQPYVVAKMSSLLDIKPGLKVLEIGTGSGYQAAVLDAMGADVYSVERVRELYTQTTNLFVNMRLHSIRLKYSDGTIGWAEQAPFDRIIVTAGGPTIPNPLIEQLAINGIMIIPVGDDKRKQQLVKIIKTENSIDKEYFDAVSFVELIGEHGW